MLQHLAAPFEGLFLKLVQRDDGVHQAHIQGLLRAIVGFRITITRLEGAWKMSQNRPEPDQAGIRAGLAANGDPRAAAVAAIMNALPPKES